MLKVPPQLNAEEIAQCGTRLRVSRYVTLEEYAALREQVVARCIQLWPALAPHAHCTAYTPGETLELLQFPEIRKWHARMLVSGCRERTTTIVLVPCAKGKPWNPPRAGLYLAYNKILRDHPDLQFVTISEPLGVVPDQFWGSFQPYDCPGLFPEAAMRHSMAPEDLVAAGLPPNIRLPFDQAARDEAIRILGARIGQWLLRHSGTRPIYAFCDSAVGQEASTHGRMLTSAWEQYGILFQRFPKREGPRVPPYEHILRNLGR